MRERYFCAAQSRANDEPVFGTVAHIRSWLLLEYPSAWRRNAIEDSKLLPAPVGSRVLELADRALLIRQDHHRRDSLRCFFVRSADPVRTTRVLLRDYDELTNLESSSGEVVNGVSFAVCTHGRHDRCCAKFGIPLFCAFRDLTVERTWQCSHVGGDRFAGNVVVFPYGIYYGRATPEDVPEIVRRSDAGEVWMPGYRGRSCYPRGVQVAEYFARRESGRLRIDEFRPLERTRTGADVSRVALLARSDSTIHTVEFRTTVSALRQRLTCEAEQESAHPQYELTGYSVATV